MLRITTAVLGQEARMRRVASIPFMFGMAMSMTTTSGSYSSARRTLSRPSPASATTAISGCFSSRARSPSRTTVWSSASSMRMGIFLVLGGPLQRQCGDDGRSPPRLRFDGEPAAEASNALLHAEQAEAADDAGVEAVAVVAHAAADAAGLPAHLYFDVVGVGVAGGVVHGLLDEPEDAGLVLVRQVVGGLVSVEHHVESGALGGFAGVPVERRHQAEIVQHGGAQQQGEVANLVDGL